MTLQETIYVRKSTRSYTNEPVNAAVLEEIRTFMNTMQPLYPKIRVRTEIVDRSCVKSIFPWTTSQQAVFFSEETDGWLENAGFMFQQLDLYLQSRGLGVCWLGMGHLNSRGIAQTDRGDGLKFVIMLAFGHAKASPHRDKNAFRRKSLSEICNGADERLEPARLAPSSVNSQPWFFTREGETIHAYCACPGLSGVPGDMNRIDMGIALAHMYISYPDTFRFFHCEGLQLKKRKYTGSFTLE